jgi:hypothetical protein
MRLSDLHPFDIDWVADAWGRWAGTARWSGPGHTPSPEMLEQLLWAGSLVQRVVTAPDGRPVAVLQVTGADLDSGNGYLELFLDPAHGTETDRAVAAFIDRVFVDFPLRKLLLDAVDGELDLPPCLDGVAVQAGCLTANERRGEGRYADRHLYEIWLDRWRARGAGHA